MQPQQDVRVTVRVDKELKENAETLFSRLGMNMSVAFNVFLRKAVDEQAIPFKIGPPSSGSSVYYDPDMITNAFQNMVAEEIASRKENGYPIARFDAEKGKAFLEYPDGSKEYIEDDKEE